MRQYQTIYCGKLHRLSDGAPVGHACRILCPAFLRAERDKRYDEAIALLHEMPIVLHDGAQDEGALEASARPRA